MNARIAAQRLSNQRITRPLGGQPADVVAWLGAVQAQEYPAARWGLALRMRKKTTDAAIRHAVDTGSILRTHVMRPTWHFVTPADIRWMLELTAPKVQRVISGYFRQLQLDTPLLTRATSIIEAAFDENTCLTRPELGARLARAGIQLKGVRLAIATIFAELERVICSGPYRGKQLTYAPFANRALRGSNFSRDEALGELARRYFRSHGPATLRDFVWWSGLATADARRAIEISRPKSQTIDGLMYWSIGPNPSPGVNAAAVHLLPIYDEYLVAYRDRVAVPHVTETVRLSTGGWVPLRNALVIGGQIAGTWKPNGRSVQVLPQRALRGSEQRGVSEAVARYERFAAET